MRVTVMGASGFVGRALVPALVEAGHEVRAMTRRPQRYRGAGDPVAGDVHDGDSLAPALADAEVAYYLVHSLDDPRFADRDARAAGTVGRVAAAAGVRRIVYLGGLGADADQLSAHLRSRREVEELLGRAGVPVTTLRAGIVIGAGGTSWEIIRQLADRLPLLVAPSWVRTRCQPIALADVVRYLLGVLDVPASTGRALDVGGAEALDYGEMLRRVAALTQRPLTVVSVPTPLPLVTSAVSALLLTLVTDTHPQTARSLIDSMANEMVVRDASIRSLVPFEPVGFDAAARAALGQRG